jgi:hypothetical protein
MVCSQKVSMASVNTWRRYKVGEYQVGMQQRHAVPGAAVGRLCQWAALGLSCG